MRVAVLITLFSARCAAWGPQRMHASRTIMSAQHGSSRREALRVASSTLGVLGAVMGAPSTAVAGQRGETAAEVWPSAAAQGAGRLLADSLGLRQSEFTGAWPIGGAGAAGTDLRLVQLPFGLDHKVPAPGTRARARAPGTLLTSVSHTRART